MSTLTFLTTVMPAQAMNGVSSLPPLSQMSRAAGIPDTDLDEDDNLWCGYGSVLSPFPYVMQDMYTRELHDTPFLTPVLENEYLKATFMPAYGGKLWSLIDKTAGRELLVANPVVRPCNLAIRNAWTSGGVEWNCGFLGHHPHTCSQLYTAQTKLDDGTPVLRMYEYERVRRVVYQMDFFLPDGSKLLLCRMRIVNDDKRPTPIYWWSNIAVPEMKGARVIAPVTETFTPINGKISKAPVPDFLDTDITYPTNQGHSIDFFWKIPDKKRKYICQLDGDGYGLVQTSTARLKGRKLFVWGQGPGGDRWQQYLTGDDCGDRYAEIQAGLANTQYESLPMPPKSAWEWLEGYGALSCDSAKAHGEWESAKAEAEDKLNDIITDDKMETILADTRKMAKSPARETILHGSGWAALENLRRDRDKAEHLCPHLDFGGLEAEQEQWKTLLESGSFGEVDTNTVPPSWMLDENWFALLERAAKGADEYNWYTWLQYGASLFSLNRIEEAKTAFDRSYSLKASPWSLYGLAQYARITGANDKCAMLTLRAAEMKRDDASLAKEAVRTLTECGRWAQTTAFIESAPISIREIPRVRLSLSMARLNLGDIEGAEKLLYEDGGIVVADIREGEVSVTELWYSIEEARAKRDSRDFDRKTAKPPVLFDFRMNAEK